MHPIDFTRGAKHWRVINLLTISMVNFFLFGAVAMHLVRVICFLGGIPRGTIGLAMFVAAILQMSSLLIMGITVPQLGASSQEGTAWLLLQAWIQMVAVLLIAWICYRRALAIRFTKPWIAPIAKGLTIVFVLVTVGARLAASVYEVPTFLFGDTPAFSRDSYFALRVGSRLVMNGSSFVFFAFMEVYVTASIIRHRHAHTDVSTQQPQTGAQEARTMLMDMSSFSARLRTAYATLIFLMNLIQVMLHMINIFITPTLFPLYQAGWALVIVRLFEFRSELETPSHTCQPFPTWNDSRPQLSSLSSARIPNATGVQPARHPSNRGPGHVASRRQPQSSSHRFG